MSAADLIDRLRYQVLRPHITTMGPCPRCGEGSRGSNVCSACLMRDLEALIGSSDADEAYYALCEMRDAGQRLHALVERVSKAAA